MNHIQVKKEKENLAVVKFQAFFRRSRAVTANKCTKKRGARAVVVLAIQTYCCFDILVVVAVVACLHGGGGTQVGGVTR